MTEPVTQEERDDFGTACRFIDALVKATQRYGVPTHDMVGTLTRIARALGLQGEFMVTPGSVQSVLRSGDDLQRVQLSVSTDASYDLARLAAVLQLANSVAATEVGTAEGFVRLRAIAREPAAYGRVAKAGAFMVAGFAFAPIMGASWMTAIAGAAIALISFGITRITGSPGIAALQEFLAAMFAAILAQAAAALVPGIHPVAATVCAVIWFIPGFGLTVAPRELVYGNTQSGLIWLTNAGIAALKLLLGGAVGVSVAQGLQLTPQVIAAAHIPQIWTWVTAPALVLALGVLMQARPKDIPGMVIGAWLAWGVSRAAAVLGAWEGTFAATALLTVYASWYGRRYHATAAVILLPCVMLLVPGYAALRALNVAEQQGLIAGLPSSSTVVAIVTAIIGGSFVGDALDLDRLARTGEAVRALIRRPRPGGPGHE